MEEDGKEHQSDGMEAHLAASKGQVDTLRDLLSTSPALFGAKDSFGKTPIFYAIEIMCLPAVELMTEAKVKVNTIDGTGQTALHVAAFKGFADGAQALLEAGAKLTVRDTNGRTPLHLCTNSSASKCMAVLLNDPKRDYIDLQDNEGMTALHWAGFHKMPNHTQALLRKGAREDVLDCDQKSPLHWAAQNGSPMCCQILLSSNSAGHLNTRDRNGNSCLHLAAAGGHSNVVKVLARSAEVNFQVSDNNGRTPLHWAAAAGHGDTCACLLAFDCNPCAVDSSDRSPLHYARAKSSPGHTLCAAMLAEATAAFKRNGHVDKARLNEMVSAAAPPVQRGTGKVKKVAKARQAAAVILGGAAAAKSGAAGTMLPAVGVDRRGAAAAESSGAVAKAKLSLGQLHRRAGGTNAAGGIASDGVAAAAIRRAKEAEALVSTLREENLNLRDRIAAAKAATEGQRRAAPHRGDAAESTAHKVAAQAELKRARGLEANLFKVTQRNQELVLHVKTLEEQLKAMRRKVDLLEGTAGRGRASARAKPENGRRKVRLPALTKPL